MDNEEVFKTAQEAEISLIRFLYCDTNSIIRGKNVPINRLRRRMVDGIGLSRALLAVNSLDELAPVEELTPVGEVRLLPDPDTFTILPYAERAGALICDLGQPDGAPWSVCGRSFLKRVCQQVAAQGWQVKAAFEMEFTLATVTDGDYRPFDQTLCYSSIALQSAHSFYLELVQALEEQGMAVELCHPELSPGQHEISISHSDPVRAADNQVRLRETVRAVAANHGLYASFAPKPFADYIGNGMHIHLSLWDEAQQKQRRQSSGGRNIFYDPAAAHGFSTKGLSFLAGILLHLPALTALTCASVNSYRRLAPHSLSGAFAAYGYDNRETALRIPSPFRSNLERSTNLELKAADATGNPYLALGALLVAGLDGLNRNLDPGPPVNMDPDTLSEEQLASMGIKRLPETLEEALDALEADAVLTDALGSLLARSYGAIKRSEITTYASGDDASQRDKAEFAGHFYKY